MNTVLSGFRNVYNLQILGGLIIFSSAHYKFFFTVLITFGVGFFVVFKIIGDQQSEPQRNLPRECVNEEIPMSLYILPLMLTFVSVFPYIKNTALRVFAIKILKQQGILFWYKECGYNEKNIFI